MNWTRRKSSTLKWLIWAKARSRTPNREEHESCSVLTLCWKSNGHFCLPFQYLYSVSDWFFFFLSSILISTIAYQRLFCIKWVVQMGMFVCILSLIYSRNRNTFQHRQLSLGLAQWIELNLSLCFEVNCCSVNKYSEILLVRDFFFLM